MNLLHLYAKNRQCAARRFEVRAQAADDSAEILLYDVIVADELEAEYWGGVAPKPFVELLRGITAKTIHLRINSPGGSVFAARAMEQALREHPAQVVVHIDGVAASAASVVAMAGEQILMGSGAMMMIHNGWSFAIGNAAEMRKTADLLDKVDGTLVQTYAKRTGQVAKQVADWMAAETWFTADEAVAHGFADALAGEATAQAQAPAWNLSAYARAPAAPVEGGTAPGAVPVNITQHITIGAGVNAEQLARAMADARAIAESALAGPPNPRPVDKAVLLRRLDARVLTA